MKLSWYKYDLPQHLIADAPRENRDESRLMVVNRKTGKIEHKVFTDILEYFDEGDVFIINNTKVFPARLYGTKEKTGAKIEVFLLRELNKESRLWDVLVDPARKIRIGNKLYFGEENDLVAEVIDNTTSRGRTLRFLFDGDYDEFKQTITNLGHTPLPSLHQRPSTSEDKERYQTIYAKHEGAVAAPTAGMHFSKELIKRLQLIGVDFAEITLHTGLGNFRSIEVEDLSKHKMDSEQIIISPEATTLVNNAKAAKKNICAIGTTSMRAIESSVTVSRDLKTCDGWTNLFLYPPHDFKIANMMISNLHLPYSTLMMNVAAFTGFDLLLKAYKEAVEEEYKFFTYGDAMLVI